MRAALKISVLFFLFSLLQGCEDKRHDCYTGKVVSLNMGAGCQNILKIVEPANKSDLPKGSTLTFDPKLSSKILNLGDIVYFKIIQFEEWEGFINAMCLWPQFTAQIEFCDN
jgi:hypothetical protein